MPKKDKALTAYKKGDKVQIVGTHPWKGFQGVVVGMEETAWKAGLKVELPSEEVSIFVFQDNHITKE